MGGMSEQHRQTFEARLARIQQGGPNCMGTIHVGPRPEVREKDLKTEKAVAKLVAAKPRRSTTMSTLAALPVAVLLGALSVFVGRVAAYRFFSEDGLYTVAVAGVPAEMFADILIASLVALILARTFSYTWGMRRVALVAGFVAMMVWEVNLMQAYPALFETAFSETYVAGMLANPPATL
jgi:hypothetical protein